MNCCFIQWAICFRFSQWEPLWGVFISFWHTPSLISGTTCAKFILYFPCPHLPFFLRVLGSFSGEWYLETRWAHCSWSVLAPRCFCWTELRNMWLCMWVCVYTHTCTQRDRHTCRHWHTQIGIHLHIHTDTHVCTHIYTCTHIHICTYIPTCTLIYTHLDTHICTHTHINTYIYIRQLHLQIFLYLYILKTMSPHQSWLHNLWVPLQNENVMSLIQKTEKKCCLRYWNIKHFPVFLKFLLICHDFFLFGI